MTARVLNLAASQDAVNNAQTNYQNAQTNYQAMRAYYMADQAVKCPKCKSVFGYVCESTGGGNRSSVPTHKARTARINGWTGEQRQHFGDLVLRAQRARSAAWTGNIPGDPPAVRDQWAAEAEAAAAPIPAAKPKPASPKGVRLYELQAEEIEGFAFRGGKGTASTAHFHGDHQHRQTIIALRDKGILAEGAVSGDGYSREYTLTPFGWQVYLNHRLIMRNSEGDRWAASLASQKSAVAA